MPPVSNATLTAFTKKLAIDHLAQNESIIIKPADKGGAVVLMDKDKC